MPVRAKFICESVTKYTDGGKHVALRACYNNAPENKAFNDATPSGEIKITISKGKPAADLFEPGREFFVDFTPAE